MVVLKERYVSVWINTHHNFLQHASDIMSSVTGRTHLGLAFGKELEQNQLEQSVFFSNFCNRQERSPCITKAQSVT